MRSWLLHSLLIGSAAANGLDASWFAEEDLSVSPLEEISDKKFFGKDYPRDKTPAVDVLHFKHPYPVVQDSDDFDKDFVKDENTDNGEWKAQTEYDRLRHKLLKEKAQVAKMTKAKIEAEQRLKEVVERSAEAAQKAQKAKEEKRVKQVKEQKEKQERAVREGKGDAASKAKPWRIPGLGWGQGEVKEKEETEHSEEAAEAAADGEAKVPGGAGASGMPITDTASEDTEKAMGKLEDCKKELQKSREELRQLMGELEKAKKRQDAAQAALDSTNGKFKVLEDKHEAAANEAKNEYEEYMEAKSEFLKQQALVAKMETDLKNAAAKVKITRGLEDNNGGVYPTPRSSAQSSACSLMVGALAFGAVLVK